MKKTDALRTGFQMPCLGRYTFTINGRCYDGETAVPLTLDAYILLNDRGMAELVKREEVIKYGWHVMQTKLYGLISKCAPNERTPILYRNNWGYMAHQDNEVNALIVEAI